MEKMRRTEAQKKVNEITKALFREMDNQGFNVGEGEIKTEGDLLGIHNELEKSIWQNIKSQYELYDC